MFSAPATSRNIADSTSLAPYQPIFKYKKLAEVPPKTDEFDKLVYQDNSSVATPPQADTMEFNLFRLKHHAELARTIDPLLHKKYADEQMAEAQNALLRLESVPVLPVETKKTFRSPRGEVLAHSMANLATNQRRQRIIDIAKVHVAYARNTISLSTRLDSKLNNLLQHGKIVGLRLHSENRSSSIQKIVDKSADVSIQEIHEDFAALKAAIAQRRHSTSFIFNTINSESDAIKSVDIDQRLLRASHKIAAGEEIVALRSSIKAECGAIEHSGDGSLQTLQEKMQKIIELQSQFDIADRKSLTYKLQNRSDSEPSVGKAIFRKTEAIHQQLNYHIQTMFFGKYPGVEIGNLRTIMGQHPALRKLHDAISDLECVDKQAALRTWKKTVNVLSGLQRFPQTEIAGPSDILANSNVKNQRTVPAANIASSSKLPLHPTPPSLNANRNASSSIQSWQPAPPFGDAAHQDAGNVEADESGDSSEYSSVTNNEDDEMLDRNIE